MAFTISTTTGNAYTYLRHSNEIAPGAVHELLHPVAFELRKRITSMPSLSAFTLGVTTQCNLRCTYCCYSGQYRNTRSHGSQSMKSDDIGPILDFIADNANALPITIGFYGGECLIELPFIKDCISHARERWPGNVKFEISTNGLLLSPKVIEWAATSGDVALFISLDGPRCINDRYRRTAGGHGSFNAIHRALKYLHSRHGDYFDNNVHLMMTVADITMLTEIARQWSDDALLAQKLPLRISTVAPNYGAGVKRTNFDDEVAKYMAILDAYDQHRDWRLLSVFFERLLAEWTARPLFELDAPLEFPTCMPHNTKLYIDTDLAIGLCEKMPDTYRIGNVANGIDWNAADKMAATLSSIIERRCASCPVARLCSVCPQLLDLNESEFDTFCHNQKVMQRTKLLLFCELAERDMI